jgi:hypothetical protein
VQSRIIIMLQLTVAIGALSAAVVWPTAQARNININTTSCQALQLGPQPLPPPAVIYNGGIANPGDFPSYTVICNVPLSPADPSANGASFYVDGDNHAADVSTSCTISGFSYGGSFLGSTSFVASGANYPIYDIYFALPAAQMPYGGRAVLACTLPTSGRGRLRGVTSIS